MNEKLFVGAAYYPEMWEEEEVEKDIQRCKELGINVLRVGEFAWGKMEPEEGVYNLGWLKSVVEKLYESGIYTIMCTPTCTPPRWLLNKYEETRLVLPDGRRAQVSSRCHPCKSSKIMRQKNAQIVTQMAREFSGCKGIIGWQIDNELYPYWEGCNCENCKAAFRAYLKDKYGSVQSLNKSWGMARWSLEYPSFNDVLPPLPEEWKHPSLVTEWWNFRCTQIYSYVEEQAAILHAHGCKNVGTDMMMNNLLSYYETCKHLDVVQFNHYERAEGLPATAFWYDFLRAVKDRPFWVTETQVGWNGSAYADNGPRAEGNVYANSFLPIASGARLNAYWHFRSHPNGHEIAHGALYSASGRAYKPSEEVKRLTQALQKCEGLLSGSAIHSQIALHFSSAAAKNLVSAPIVKGLDYAKILQNNYHAPLFSHNVDVIDLPHSLEGYKVLISPFTTTLTQDFKARVKEWVEGGGTWIVGPMTDIMTDFTSRYVQSPCPFVEELGGVYVKYENPVENPQTAASWQDGTTFGASVCYAALQPQTAQTLATYTAGDFTGYAAATVNNVGKGKVIVVGTVTDGRSLLKLIDLPPIAPATPNIRLVRRDNGVITAVETQGKVGSLTLCGEWEEVIEGRRGVTGEVALTPYKVVVLRRE